MDCRPDQDQVFPGSPPKRTLGAVGWRPAGCLAFPPGCRCRTSEGIGTRRTEGPTAEGVLPKPTQPLHPISTADFGRAVSLRYIAALEDDDCRRAGYPTKAAIDAELDRIQFKHSATEPRIEKLSALDATLDYLVLHEARSLNSSARRARLTAPRTDLAEREASHRTRDLGMF